MLASLRSRSARLGHWPRRLAALTCLVLAVATFANHRSQPHAAAPPTHSIVLAARELPVGHRLTERDLTRRRWPNALVPANTSTRPDQLVGKLLASPVARGEPLSPRLVVGRDLTAGLSSDQVAAVVTIDGSNTAALIRAGDRVDVLGSPQPVDSGNLSPTADPSQPIPARSPGSNADDGGHGTTTAPSVLATDARVVAVLTGSGDLGDTVDVVIATDRPAALRLVRGRSSQIFTLFPRAP